MSNAVVMKIISLVDGEPTEFDDQYVVDYDPTVQGFTPSGAPMLCRLETTPDVDKAARYDSVDDALAVYRRSDGLREDGRPNRPITAFNIEFSKVDVP